MRETIGVRKRMAWATWQGTLLVVVLAVLLLGGCDVLNTLIGDGSDPNGMLSGDEFEDNDTLGQAVAIDRDQSYSAYIGENDADYFSFTTAHGSATFDEVEISVTNVGDDLIIGVAVYDPAGELVGTSSASTGGADRTYTLRNLQSDGT